MSWSCEVEVQIEVFTDIVGLFRYCTGVNRWWICYHAYFIYQYQQVLLKSQISFINSLEYATYFTSRTYSECLHISVLCIQCNFYLHAISCLRFIRKLYGPHLYMLNWDQNGLILSWYALNESCTGVRKYEYFIIHLFLYISFL